MGGLGGRVAPPDKQPPAQNNWEGVVGEKNAGDDTKFLGGGARGGPPAPLSHKQASPLP
jgi:hypothetical protein